MPKLPAIRKLTTLSDQDLEQILSIERRCFSDPWRPSMFRVSEQEGILVAEENTKLLGYGCYLRVLDECHILNVAVDPEHRRRGIGRRLVESMAAVSDGIRDVYLEVRPSNLNAIRLYEGMGFGVIGRRKGYYPDGEDAVVMHMRCS